jgi:hypothetical protein
MVKHEPELHKGPAALVTQLVTQGIGEQLGATAEMRSDKAEQWSG